MAIRINLPTIPAYSLPLNLEGFSMYLRAVYQERNTSWFLDVLDVGFLPIERGIKLTPFQPIIMFGLDKWILNGNLFVMPTTNELDSVGVGSLITRDNFAGSNNFQLMYIPREEFGLFGVTEYIL